MMIFLKYSSKKVWNGCPPFLIRGFRKHPYRLVLWEVEVQNLYRLGIALPSFGATNDKFGATKDLFRTTTQHGYFRQNQKILKRTPKFKKNQQFFWFFLIFFGYFWLVHWLFLVRRVRIFNKHLHSITVENYIYNKISCLFLVGIHFFCFGF